MNGIQTGIQVFALAGLSFWAAAAPPSDPGSIFLEADQADDQIKNGLHHFTGNVILDAPNQLHLTCDDLLATLGGDTSGTNTVAATPGSASTNGPARLDRIVASGSVVIQLFPNSERPGGTTNIVYAYGSNATYSRTNALLTLIGNPRLVTGEYTVTAEEALYYDVALGRLKNGGRYRMVIKSDILKNSGFGKQRRTNSVAKPDAGAEPAPK